LERIGVIGMATDFRPALPPTNCTELWGFPDDEWWPHFDRLFEVHQPPFGRHDEAWYQLRLAEAAQDAPIVTSDNYPLDEVIKIGGDNFQSSLDYMLGMAIYLDPAAISLWGVSDHEKYHYQRESMARWVGVAQGRGITVDVECDLLKYRPHRPEFTKRYGFAG